MRGRGGSGSRVGACTACKRRPVRSNLGNSGTSMRLLAGLLAGQTFDTILTGDASLTRRPMRRVITPLERMGGAISCTSEGTAPLVIRGGRSLRGIDYALPIASAQVKSAVLLCGLYAEGPTRLREPAESRDHTERMLRRFGAAIATEGGVVRLTPGTPLRATRVDVPADLSSAAFFLVGAAMSPGSDLVTRARRGQPDAHRGPGPPASHGGGHRGFGSSLILLALVLLGRRGW